MPRVLAIGAGAVLMASVSLVAATSASATSGRSGASDCWCTTKQVDRSVNTYDQAQVVDPGVAVYVGGDLTVESATEIEGRVVVAGDAGFTGSGALNIGTAGGGGSAIAPQGRTDHLVVGGNLTTGPTVQVGFNAAGGGGNVRVGGHITGDVSTKSYRGRAGSVRKNLGADALKDYADLGRLVTQAADDAAGATPAQVVGGVLTIAPGVHEISAADAARLSRLDITSRGAVTIAVRGTSVAIEGLQHVEVGGTRVYQKTEYLSRDIRWVFPDATTVRLGTNDQFPGTVVVPRDTSTLSVATSTNGRILAAGDVAYRGGAGIEHHNYPWSSECSDSPAPGRSSAPSPSSTPSTAEDDDAVPSAEPLAAEESASPSPEPTVTAEPTATTEPTATAELAANPEPVESAEPAAAVLLAADSPESSPSPAAVAAGDDGSGDTDGDAAAAGQDGLAHTGAAVTGGIVAAVVLVAGGLVLLRLRRRSGRHTVEA